jgi:hypothetical protein
MTCKPENHNPKTVAVKTSDLREKKGVNLRVDKVSEG